mmetsp:Transcript_33877/g.71829  ORF Transcript_33877/g.71829 Transcript_33877/m.71829 type:complete len:572 (+) Transcript_33877:337-2052(+)
MGFLGQHISRPGKNFAPREPDWRRRVVAEALADASVVMRLAQLESQAKSMIGTKLSPDAKSVISDILLPVIKDDIEAAISREFVSVQQQLTDLVDGLDVKTQQAVTSKAAADTSDNKLDTCRSNEKTALDQYETCEVDRAAKIVSDAQHCQTKRDAALQICAEKDAAADLSFSDLCAPTQCNLADGNMCNMEEFTKAVEGMNAIVKQKHDDYLEKIQQCNAADKVALDVCAAAEEFAASDSCKEEREQAQHQQVQCESDYGQAKVAICSFGSALQGKCVDLSEVRSLIAKIKASDRKDSLSESDRQHEWEAVQRLSCLLEALRDEGDLSQQAATTCAASRPYPHTFDYLDARIAQLTTTENFNCDETSVSFSGYWWSTGEKSSEFERVASSHTVSLEDGSTPFLVCSDDGAAGKELLGSAATVVASNKLGEIEASKHFEVSFVFNPKGTAPGGPNLFQFTIGGNNAKEGDRLPAVWVHSGSTRLHVRSSRQGNLNDGCDPEQLPPLNQDTTVLVRVADGEMNVFFNGNNVCKSTNYANPTVVTQPLLVYASNPWHPSAPATIAHLTYKPLP